jgi:hypothetical protein
MISMAQARALVESCRYRDWSIGLPNPARYSASDFLKIATVEASGRCPVLISYEAPNSDPGMEWETVQNDLHVALALTETEAEFARSLYEAIATVEEHERREFFKIGYGELDHKVIEKRSHAVFHPHGVNRDKLFHDLDPFAKDLQLVTVLGTPFTADAVA